MKMTKYFLLVLIIAVLLAGCAGKEPAVQTVEAYLNAIVNQDETAVTSLACEEWSFDAMLEMDSFLAVSPQLQDLSCSVTGTDGDYTLVACTGSILATYNDEQQTFDLSARTYQVSQVAGEWLLCGYHQD